MKVCIILADSLEQLQDNINQVLAELKDKWIVDVKPLSADGTSVLILYANRSASQKNPPWVK